MSEKELNEERIINSIALQQAIIEELKKIKRQVDTSETNIRVKIETKHWYGYSEPFLLREKNKIETSKYTMQIILDEAIKQSQERINKLIDIEIERRNGISEEK